MLSHSIIWQTPLYTTGLMQHTRNSPLYISRVSGYILLFFYFLAEALFTLTNSLDPDEMLHYAAFYLSLHCFFLK